MGEWEKGWRWCWQSKLRKFPFFRLENFCQRRTFYKASTFVIFGSSAAAFHPKRLAFLRKFAAKSKCDIFSVRFLSLLLISSRLPDLSFRPRDWTRTYFYLLDIFFLFFLVWWLDASVILFLRSLSSSRMHVYLNNIQINGANKNICFSTSLDILNFLLGENYPHFLIHHF